MRPLGDAAGWMKLIGILSIVQGVLMVFTIIGILFAWLPIWMGVLLLKASDKSSAAVATGSEDAAVEANESLRTMFKVYGIIITIFLVWGAIAIAFGVLALITSSS